MEIIAALVILGILALFVTLGPAQVMKGYLAARDAADTALKGQVAMARIVKELRSLDSVATGTQTAMTYSFNLNGTQVSGRTLGRNGSELLLGGRVLADGVTQFQLTYYNSYTHAGAGAWDSNKKLIGVSLSLDSGQGETAAFSVRVRPRNLP